MFATADPEGFETVVPGVRRKTLCYGDETLMAEFRLDRDHVLPAHAHPQEQTGYLVAGRLRLTIGGSAHCPTFSLALPSSVVLRERCSVVRMEEQMSGL